MTNSEYISAEIAIEEMERTRELIEKCCANAMGKKPALYRGLLDAGFLIEEVNDGSIEDTREPKSFVPAEELTESHLHPLYLDMILAEPEEPDVVAEPVKNVNATVDRYAKMAEDFVVDADLADFVYARARKGNDYLVVVPKGNGKKSAASLDAQDGFEEKYGDDFGPTRVKMTRTSLEDRSQSGGSERHRSINVYRRQKCLPKGGATIRRDPTLPIRVAAVSNVASIGNVMGIAKAVAKQFGVKVIQVSGFAVIAD